MRSGLFRYSFLIISVVGLKILIRHTALPFVLQSSDDKPADEVIDHGKQRCADQHPDHAPKSAEKQNGEQDTEAREAELIPEDLRAYQVSVKLLQYYDENEEHDRHSR